MLELCRRGEKDLIEVLYNAGFIFDSDCYNQLIYSRNTFDCFEFLLSIGCPIDTEDRLDITELIKKDDVRTLKLIIENNFGEELTDYEAINSVNYKAIKCFEYIMSSNFWVNVNIFVDEIDLYDIVEKNNEIEYAKIMLKYNFPRRDFKLDHGIYNETQKLLFEYGFPTR